MTLIYDKWVFSVDLSTTKQISKIELDEHCTCDFCRNYYRTVQNQHPALDGFLKQFGLEIFAPDSLHTYLHRGFVEYAAEYRVAGNVMIIGDRPISIDGLQVVADDEGECFYLCFKTVLPWEEAIPLEYARSANGTLPPVGFWNNAEYSS